MVQFSLVLPVHNQACFLKRNLPIIKRKLDKLGIDYEIIIAEDGSTDQSYKIEFVEKNNLNVSWLFIYQWDLEVMGVNESWNYIKNNFRPVQIAFIRQGEKFSPVYLLLKKGGSFNETLLNQKIQEKINKNEVGIKEYELSYGKVYLYYLNFE